MGPLGIELPVGRRRKDMMYVQIIDEDVSEGGRFLTSKRVFVYLAILAFLVYQIASYWYLALVLYAGDISTLPGAARAQGHAIHHPVSIRDLIPGALDTHYLARRRLSVCPLAPRRERDLDKAEARKLSTTHA